MGADWERSHPLCWLSIIISQYFKIDQIHACCPSDLCYQYIVDTGRSLCNETTCINFTKERNTFQMDRIDLFFFCFFLNQLQICDRCNATSDLLNWLWRLMPIFLWPWGSAFSIEWLPIVDLNDILIARIVKNTLAKVNK